MLVLQAVLVALLLSAVVTALLDVARGQRPVPQGVSLSILALLLGACVLPALSRSPMVWWQMLPSVSVASGVLAAWWWQHRLGLTGAIPRPQWLFCCGILVLLALVLYVADRVFWTVDIYGAGYGDFRFSGAILIVGLAAWVLKMYWGCILLALAQGAVGVGVMSSSNAWDYLVDPWVLLLAVLAVVVILAGGGKAPPPADMEV